MSEIVENLKLENLFTPIPEAVAEIKRRQNDTALQHAVLEYLDGDIPAHFRNGPIFYLSRHVATPNFETLRFIELCELYDLPMVIGQDTEDVFVSNNTLKRVLGKMPIVKGITHDRKEVLENIRIVNFDSAQGKKFKDIVTTFGFNLVEFHNKLFRIIYPERVTILDDSTWVTRNGRGDILGHYQKFLTLLLCHGIMFEDYTEDDTKFVQEVLAPAFRAIQERFGCKPLVCNLIPEEIRDYHPHEWLSYPSVVYKIVKSSLDQDDFSSVL